MHFYIVVLINCEVQDMNISATTEMEALPTAAKNENKIAGSGEKLIGSDILKSLTDVWRCMYCIISCITIKRVNFLFTSCKNSGKNCNFTVSS